MAAGAQIVLLAAQRMPAVRIAAVVFSDRDTVRELIHNLNRALRRDRPVMALPG